VAVVESVTDRRRRRQRRHSRVGVPGRYLPGEPVVRWLVCWNFSPYRKCVLLWEQFEGVLPKKRVDVTIPSDTDAKRSSERVDEKVKELVLVD